MYNTTLLKILPASGKLGFISPARSLTFLILRPTTKLKTQYIGTLFFLQPSKKNLIFEGKLDEENQSIKETRK
jgi:hypothetical protein